MSPTAVRTYAVTGMTCAHCVRSVVEEVSEVPGVSAVEVHLDSGRAEVSGEGFSDDEIRLAVQEAGYQVAP